MTVHDAAAHLLIVLDRAGGELPSERLVAELEACGIDGATASTAMAYAIQEGNVGLDWAFTVHKRPQHV